MHIRNFEIGDEPALLRVFLSAVREVASKDYTPEQIEAWASAGLDRDVWTHRMRDILPFVVEVEGQIVAYADLQSSGHIDHFFVSGGSARRGIGRQLMDHLLATARARGISILTSDVSQTAQPFFVRFGFVVVEQRAPVLRGVVIPNALMRFQGVQVPSRRC